MKLLTRNQTLAAIKQLSHRQMKVYYCIVMYYNEQYGYSFPTVETISADTGISDNKIYRELRELESKGFIRTEKNPDKKYNKNNIYYILDKTSVPNVTDVTVNVTPNVTDTRSTCPGWKPVVAQPLPKRTEKPEKLNDMQKSEQNILQSAERVSPKVSEKFIMVTDDEIRQLVAEKNGAKLRELQTAGQNEWMKNCDKTVGEYVKKFNNALWAVQNGWLLCDDMIPDIPDDDMPF